MAVADFYGVCSGDIYVFECVDANILLPELLPFICQTYAFFDIDDIAKQSHQPKPQEALSMLGLSVLLKEHGHRLVQKNFKRFFSTRSLERLHQKIKDLDFNIFNKAAPFHKIDNDLQTFQPLKMTNFAL